MHTLKRSDGGVRDEGVTAPRIGALSPCLFAMLMDRMTDDIREESPWTMMLADDIVICSESKEQVEENLKSWIYALERRGLKVNRRMYVNERQVNDTVKMHARRPGGESGGFQIPDLNCTK